MSWMATHGAIGKIRGSDLARGPSKGSTVSRNPSSTTRRILAAAKEEFGANGFDGTKMEHIARRARVSKQLVYLYFHSKHELYGEMLQAVTRGAYEYLLKIDYAVLDPEGAIRTYIDALYDRFLTEPVTAILTLDQSLHDGAQTRIAPETERLHKALTVKLGDALTRGQAAGVFGAHTDVAGLEFMAVIIVSGCVSSRGMFGKHLSANAFEDGSSIFWKDYATNFILRALRA